MVGTSQRSAVWHLSRQRARVPDARPPRRNARLDRPTDGPRPPDAADDARSRGRPPPPPATDARPSATMRRRSLWSPSSPASAAWPAATSIRRTLMMIYLLVVVIAAARFGRGPSLLAATLSVLAFDFFFYRLPSRSWWGEARPDLPDHAGGQPPHQRPVPPREDRGAAQLAAVGGLARSAHAARRDHRRRDVAARRRGAALRGRARRAADVDRRRCAAARARAVATCCSSPASRPASSRHASGFPPRSSSAPR